MSEKHTAGPWVVTVTTGIEGDILVETTRSRTICEVHNHIDVEPGDVVANARLIAAAPKLLAACEYVVKYHREHDSGEGELYGLDFVTTCLAAIAKTTQEDRIKG